MKPKIIVLSVWIMTFIGILVVPFPQVLCQTRENRQPDKKNTGGDSSVVSLGENSERSTLISFDSILVIHFHPTAQCSCCINVGNFSKKGLEKFYSKPYKDRRIIFKECNIDEDSLTTRKYKIFGSALGFKKIRFGKEEFSEIGSVWEFCEEEDKFLINFQKELDSFIAGKKDEGVNNATK